MIDPVKAVVSSPSATADRRGSGSGGSASPTSSVSSPASADVASPPPVEPTDQPLRLVVEPTEGGDNYVYKLFDRATGELVMELPQEQAAKMSQSPDYAAGQVINAKA